MIKLSNEHLQIQIAEHGAELSSLSSGGKEYLWQADPAFWARHSPVLFPIVGGVWENKYRQDGQVFTLGQHGFARDSEFEVISVTETEAFFGLTYTQDTLAKYPYKFRLEIGYRLHDKCVDVLWKVINLDSQEIHFQIGAHPAFYFPVYDENPDRGYFAFHPTADLNYIRIKAKGCVDNQVHYPVPVTEEGLLPLNTHTFDIDTFIIEDSQVQSVCLMDLQKNPYLSVHFTAPLVGLWSPPTKNAPFVCIEPWYGRCDRAEYTGDYQDKDWMNHLPVGGEFNASYTIQIH